MKHIKDLAEDIREEMEGAMHYAKRAMEYKDKDKERADKYAEMSRQEMMHAEALHNMAVKAIKKYTDEGGTAPAAMLAVWEWEHEKMIDGMGKAKAMLDMYRS